MISIHSIKFGLDKNDETQLQEYLARRYSQAKRTRQTSMSDINDRSASLQVKLDQTAMEIKGNLDPRIEDLSNLMEKSRPIRDSENLLSILAPLKKINKEVIDGI